MRFARAPRRGPGPSIVRLAAPFGEPTPPPARSDARLVSRLMRQAAPEWPSIAALMLLGLLAAPLVLLGPLPLAIVVDSVIGDRALPAQLGRLLPPAVAGTGGGRLAVAAALLVGTALLWQLSELATALLRARTGDRLVLGLRARIFRHVQRLSIAFHDGRGTADSLYRIQWDAPSLQYLVIDGVIPLASAVVTLAAMLVVIARIDIELALVALVVCPVLLVLSHVYRNRLRLHARELKQRESAAYAVLQEVLGALRVVKAFGQEEREERRFVTRAGESARVKLRLTLAEGGYGLLVNVTTAVGSAIVLVVGVGHVRAGTLTLGGLLLVVGYLAKLYDPLRTIGRKATSVQSFLASAERAFALLDEAPDVPDRPGARPLARAIGAVAFEGVSFGYGDGPAVLRDATFEVRPGSRVGIIGTTGGGKTTLVSLLTRFYDPEAGVIRLDGVDLRDLRLADVRRQFGLMLQDPVLFSSSVAENIRYARPEATDEEVVRAARAAHAHDFISALPDGYATVVGERGMRMSGGERQRISLARAFLKDAPVLILDEPTSAMDVRTEAVIIDAMSRLMHGRTTFMIAHRTGTLAGCDVVLSVEDGRVTPVPVPAPARPLAARAVGGADDQ